MAATQICQGYKCWKEGFAFVQLRASENFAAVAGIAYELKEAYQISSESGGVRVKLGSVLKSAV